MGDHVVISLPSFWPCFGVTKHLKYAIKIIVKCKVCKINFRPKLRSKTAKSEKGPWMVKGTSTN